jgi:hypothetical protein
MNGITSDVIIADLTGAGWMGQDTGSRLRPTREEVARLAYQRYESNGHKDGNDMEDWLRAEHELTHHYA